MSLTAFHFLFVTLPATSYVVPYGFVIVPRHLSDPGRALSDALFCCTRSLYQAFIHIHDPRCALVVTRHNLTLSVHTILHPSAQRPPLHFLALLPLLDFLNYSLNQPSGLPEIMLALGRPPLHLLNRDRVVAPLSANPKYPTLPIFALSSRPCRVSRTSSLPLNRLLAGQYPSYLNRNVGTIIPLLLYTPGPYLTSP